jgi:hypothetical protein
MKRFPRKKVAEALNILAKDILRGKVKVESMEVRIDYNDVPGEFMMEKHPTGKQWLTITLIRKNTNRRKGGGNETIHRTRE